MPRSKGFNIGIKSVVKFKSDANSKSVLKSKSRVESKSVVGSKSDVGLKSVVGPKSAIDIEIERIEASISAFKKAVDSPKNVVLEKIPSATIIEKKIEQEIKKEIVNERSYMSAGTLNLVWYFLISVFCVGLLGYLFGSVITIIFYSFFGFFMWWWAHNFHTERVKTHHSIICFGMVVVFLYLSYWIFDDLLSLSVCVLYSLSFVVASVLYLYHFKREISHELHSSFPRTFLVVFYSHVIAFAVASSVAFIIPNFLLENSFVGVIFLFMTWILPVIFVYFFMNKFLYFSFFDKKHVSREFLHALVYSLAYAAIFMMLLVIGYVLTAIQLRVAEQQSYEDTFTDVFQKMQNVAADIDAVSLNSDSNDLRNLAVSIQIKSMAKETFDKAARLKSEFSAQKFTLYDYISDDYFAMLSANRISLARLSARSDAIFELKDDLLREYAVLFSMTSEGLYGDVYGGVYTDLNHYYVSLVLAVDSAHISYRNPLVLSGIDSVIAGKSYDSFLESSIIDFSFLSFPEFSGFSGWSSNFGKGAYYPLFHSKIFRDIVILMFDSARFSIGEFIDPPVIKEMTAFNEDETLESKVLRQRIILSNFNAINAVIV